MNTWAFIYGSFGSPVLSDHDFIIKKDEASGRLKTDKQKCEEYDFMIKLLAAKLEINTKHVWLSFEKTETNIILHGIKWE